MPSEVAPYYLQLAGPGAVMTMLHCGGMCGPIVAGLGLGQGGLAAGSGRLGLYQLGRALSLGAAGALCGLLSYAVSDRIELWSPWLALGLAVVMLAAVARRLGWLRLPGADGAGGLAARLVRPWAGFAGRHPRLGIVILGTALGALPCGVVFWVLGLAAASASPLHGALLAVLLVAISTPPLLLAALGGGAVLGRWRDRLAWLPGMALTVSALWLGAHGAAALAWIPHAHLWKLMLW